MRFRTLILSVAMILIAIVLAVWLIRSRKPQPQQAAASPAAEQVTVAKQSYADSSPTKLYAHNLLLRKGPDFGVYVRWLQGDMTRTRKNVNPSFDDPESFFLYIHTGVLRANIGDIANYLNKGLANSPMTNIKLTGDGQQVKLAGTIRKVVPLPVEVIGTLSAMPDDRIHLQVTKLNVLKVPFKAVLGIFKVTVSDLFNGKSIDGLEVTGNDIYFNTQKLLPPPHIKGHLTGVRIANPDLEEVFGDAREQVDKVEEWRNFLRLRGGTIDFGKLTMRNVDLIMIDISKDLWFNLDLTNYQQQLINGFTRMTPESGMQIFMPDLRDIPPSQLKKNTSIDWFKNRNIPPPPEITSSKH